MRSTRSGSFAQILLTAYWVAIMCFPLGAWNRQPGSEAILESLRKGSLDGADLIFVSVFALPGAVFLIGHAKRIRWLMWFALTFDAVWFYLQIKSWWVPYVVGATPQWQHTYARKFSESYKFLPTFGTHLAPDAMHTVLGFLLLVALVTGVMGLLATPPAKQDASEHGSSDGRT